MEDEGKFGHLDVLMVAVDDPGEEAQRLRDVGPLIATRWIFPQWHRRVLVASVSCSERHLGWLALSAAGQELRLLYQKLLGYPYSFQLRLYRLRVSVMLDDSLSRIDPMR